MSDELTVWVTDFGRKYLYMQWRDPVTGAIKSESTKKTRRRDAERVAGEKEKELRAGIIRPDGSIDWAEFRDAFEATELPGKAPNTRRKISSVLNKIEEFQRPGSLRAVGPRYLGEYVAWLRDGGRTEQTIASHVRTLRSVLAWAVTNHYLAVVPAMPAIPRAKFQRVMKGRPLTDPEFAAMLAAIPKAFPKGTADRVLDSWRDMLRGLWVSGLRLQEALDLTWDNSEGLQVDLSDRRPLMRIPAESDKGRQTRLLPITPDFAEILEATTEAARVGFVFRPLSELGNPLRHQANVSRTISLIGEKADIVVNGETGKVASAHDLRRSFGHRWSRLVPPVVLKELMRHSSIETTLRYYVSDDANRLADDVWEAWERSRRHNTPHNTRTRKKTQNK